MKVITLIITIASTIFMGALSAPRQYDPCDVYGVIYIESDPRRAHFRVYEETSEAFSDVIVFEEKNRLYADAVGKWHFTDNRDFADFFVYFEEERGLADFAIFFTEYESFAGCNK